MSLWTIVVHTRCGITIAIVQQWKSAFALTLSRSYPVFGNRFLFFFFHAPIKINGNRDYRDEILASTDGMPTIQSIQLFSLVKMLRFGELPHSKRIEIVQHQIRFSPMNYISRCREHWAVCGVVVIYMLHNDDTYFRVHAADIVIARLEKYSSPFIHVAVCVWTVCLFVCLFLAPR